MRLFRGLRIPQIDGNERRKRKKDGSERKTEVYKTIRVTAFVSQRLKPFMKL